MLRILSKWSLRNNGLFASVKSVHPLCASYVTKTNPKWVLTTQPALKKEE